MKALFAAALVCLLLVAGAYGWRDGVRDREEAEAAADAHYRGAGYQRLQVEIWREAVRRADPYSDAQLLSWSRPDYVGTRCRGVATSTIVYGEIEAGP